MIENKNILFFVNTEDLKEKSKFIDYLIKKLSKNNIRLVLFYPESLKFEIEETGQLIKINDLRLLDSILVTSDYVVNLIRNLSVFREIQRKIEKYDIDFLGNSYSDIELTLEKIHIKSILEKIDFKTPVFEKIDSKPALYWFNNFPQPSRIFSKDNSYFSEKIDNLNKLEDIIDSINNSNGSYYIERWVDGVDVYTLVYLNSKNDISIFSKSNSRDFKNEELNDKVKGLFNRFSPKKFILVHSKITKKGDIYFLNIFTRLHSFLKDDLFDEWKDVFDNFLD